LEAFAKTGPAALTAGSRIRSGAFLKAVKLGLKLRALDGPGRSKPRAGANRASLKCVLDIAEGRCTEVAHARKALTGNRRMAALLSRFKRAVSGAEFFR
jgi:hypothetical protein